MNMATKGFIFKENHPEYKKATTIPKSEKKLRIKPENNPLTTK